MSSKAERVHQCNNTSPSVYKCEVECELNVKYNIAQNTQEASNYKDGNVNPGGGGCN